MDIKEFLGHEWVDAYLMHSNSTYSADMYYTTRFLAGDAFTYLNCGHEVLMVSGMEKGRAEKESRIADIRSSSDYGLKEEAKAYKDSGEAYCRVLARLLKGEGLHKVAVPRDFPVFYADCLERAGFQITCVKSPVIEQREIKTQGEIQAITTTQRACEQATARAVEVISKAETVNGELMTNGKPLTSEAVRAVIHHSLLDAGCEADSTIVACGPRSADPHWQGEGVLMADLPIVLDVFPRHAVHRYYSDMSRTVVRGEPDPTIVEMHQVVLSAQEAAFGLIGPGVNGSEVHQAVCDTFTDAGFSVGDGEGFIHSTGHGVGLDVHERPGLGLQDVVLEAGNVVTVEPGLYYRDVGGVRVEDIVVVTASGCKNLTTFDKNLRI
ncbi:MAG: Xaa-Pro peptidase family protein [Methanosarcinales archaeon]|nr:Xaa-Pro peptidase family protein [Methanosarcinales archaeon]